MSEDNSSPLERVFGVEAGKEIRGEDAKFDRADIVIFEAEYGGVTICEDAVVLERLGRDFVLPGTPLKDRDTTHHKYWIYIRAYRAHVACPENLLRHKPLLRYGIE